jgi:hypothetical protein
VRDLPEVEVARKAKALCQDFQYAGARRLIGDAQSELPGKSSCASVCAPQTMPPVSRVSCVSVCVCVA